MTEERRVVTVLFADVVGSTGLGESLDPEDVRWLMTTYFNIAREASELYGGTVQKFIGDAVMATFGLPEAHDDDARRALSAALELRDRVRSDERLAGRVRIRLGVNTGEIASGLDQATGQLVITGDAVNVAARLQQHARPWSIVVGERTAQAAGSAFAFGPLHELEARGRSTPVRASELVGARPPTSLNTPFVGREHDLGQLQLLARRVFAESRPWLVTVLAPPGTGKSRLLAELLAALPESDGQVAVVVARCLPYGQRLAYQPMREVLESLIDLPPGSSPTQVVELSAAWLERAGVLDARRTAELLATTVGIEVGGNPALTGELLIAWRTLIEAAASQRPLVLAFEDLHWASDALLDLVDFALQPRRDVAALLIAVARPELLERRPSWSSGRRNVTTLDLAPLARGPLATIVGHLLEPAEPELIDAVIARAEGNPFFAMEIVRSLNERARGAGLGERLRLARALPDTVQATIQTRLDHLPQVDRRLLQLGAVFGRSFSIPGVAALARIDEADAKAAVERLMERDLVALTGADEVAARHILIRDVAYHGMPRAERAAAHASAARWLAQPRGARDQPAELIAYHLREAAALLGGLNDRAGELPGIRREAVAWLRRAAERAQRAAASADAADQLQAAIELAEPAELPELYERLGDAELQGELSTGAYTRALELAREVGLTPDTQLRVLGKLLLQYTRSQGAVATRPSAEQMQALLEDGNRLLEQSGDPPARARYLIARAFVPFWANEPAQATQRRAASADAREGLEVANAIDDANLRSAALDALTFLSGDWIEALGHARSRLDFGEGVQMTERVDAHAVVTWAACTVGQLDEALRVSAAGLGLVREGQVPSYALHLAAWRAYALRLTGEWDELEQLAERQIELWLATGRSAAGFALRGFIDAFDVARARGSRERVERLRGVVEAIVEQFPAGARAGDRVAFLDPTPAALRTFLEPSLVAEETRVGGAPDYIERAAAAFIDANGDLEAAHWRELVALAVAGGCRLVEAQARRGHGLASADSAELRTALDIAQAARARPLIARLQVELGRMNGDHDTWEAGRLTLHKLGDRMHLVRIQGAEGGRHSQPDDGDRK